MIKMWMWMCWMCAAIHSLDSTWSVIARCVLLCCVASFPVCFLSHVVFRSGTCSLPPIIRFCWVLFFLDHTVCLRCLLCDKCFSASVFVCVCVYCITFLLSFCVPLACGMRVSVVSVFHFLSQCLCWIIHSYFHLFLFLWCVAIDILIMLELAKERKHEYTHST